MPRLSVSFDEREEKRGKGTGECKNKSDKTGGSRQDKLEDTENGYGYIN